jgi:sulfopyruvate decarboxylase subunit alpha
MTDAGALEAAVAGQAHATSIPAQQLLDAIAAAGVTHVITVPDTHMKSLLDLLAKQDAAGLLTVCTEDEAIGINAGLFIAGHRPMMLIQNNGLYACVNTLKAIALDAQVPTVMLIGQYGRDTSKPVEENRLRAVRLLEPTLELWGVPFARLDRPDDLPRFQEIYRRALESRGPAAAIVGAPTC